MPELIAGHQTALRDAPANIGVKVPVSAGTVAVDRAANTTAKLLLQMRQPATVMCSSHLKSLRLHKRQLSLPRRQLRTFLSRFVDRLSLLLGRLSCLLCYVSYLLCSLRPGRFDAILVYQVIHGSDMAVPRLIHPLPDSLECLQKHDYSEFERVKNHHVCTCQLSQPGDMDDIAAKSSQCPADMH